MSVLHVRPFTYFSCIIFWLGQSQHLNDTGDQVEGRSIKAQPRPENKPATSERTKTWPDQVTTRRAEEEVV